VNVHYSSYKAKKSKGTGKREQCRFITTEIIEGGQIIDFLLRGPGLKVQGSKSYPDPGFS
jgi:hypothetical protein